MSKNNQKKRIYKKKIVIAIYIENRKSLICYLLGSKSLFFMTYSINEHKIMIMECSINEYAHEMFHQ